MGPQAGGLERAWRALRPAKQTAEQALELVALSGDANRQLVELEGADPRDARLDHFSFDAADLTMFNDLDETEGEVEHLLFIWRSRLTSYFEAGAPSTLPGDALGRLMVILDDTDDVQPDVVVV